MDGIVSPSSLLCFDEITTVVTSSPSSSSSSSLGKSSSSSSSLHPPTSSGNVGVKKMTMQVWISLSFLLAPKQYDKDCDAREEQKDIQRRSLVAKCKGELQEVVEVRPGT